MKIDKLRGLRYIGYNGQQIDKPLEEKIDSIICEIESVITGAYTYKNFDIAVHEKYVEIIGTNLTLKGEKIVQHLKDCKGVVLMASTLGLAADRYIKKMSVKSNVDGLIADGLCSSYVESYCDKCNDEIDQYLEEHSLSGTFRFSPGYGDLPLETNTGIINVIDGTRKIGIYTTDSHALSPSKSVVAIIGYHDVKELLEKKSPNTCGNDSCQSCSLKEKCILKS